MANTEVALKSTLVPKAALNRRGPIAQVKATAIRLWELCQIEDRRLLPLSKPSEKFKPAIDQHWLFEMGLNTYLSGALFVGLGDLVVSGVTLGVLGGTNPGGYAIALPALAFAQLAWVPVGVAHRKISVGKRRNFNAFLLWLQGRYAVNLNRKQGLSGHLASSTSPWKRDFQDDLGRWLQLVELSGFGGGYIVRERDSDDELSTTVAALEPAKPKFSRKALKAPDVQLPSVLKSLFFQIEEHLDVLAGRSLSPESDHVVARAARDRDAITALIADLIRLKVPRLDREQEAAIKRTFTTLLSELQEVTRKETTFALEALNIENTYVAAREVKPGIRLKKELER